MEHYKFTEDFGFEILGFCGYCHGSIHVGDDYSVENGQMYHPGCKEQKNTYYDSFDLDEE